MYQTGKIRRSCLKSGVLSTRTSGRWTIIRREKLHLNMKSTKRVQAHALVFELLCSHLDHQTCFHYLSVLRTHALATILPRLLAPLSQLEWSFRGKERKSWHVEPKHSLKTSAWNVAHIVTEALIPTYAHIGTGLFPFVMSVPFRLDHHKFVLHGTLQFMNWSSRWPEVYSCSRITEIILFFKAELSLWIYPDSPPPDSGCWLGAVAVMPNGLHAGQHYHLY